MIRRILLTGPDGFVGAHALEHFLVNTDWEIVCLASWTHGGITERLVENHLRDYRSRVKVHTHDLVAPLSPLLLKRIGTIDSIVNFAAESHVDTSIEQPRMVISNNVEATLTMLEAARALKPRVFVQFSTDEVFGPTVGDEGHPEWSPLLPSNPYSGSKAATESIAVAYWRTYGVPLVIVNAMNMVGERQHPEKFLPRAIRAILRGETVSLHASADGADIGSRVYLHARNSADALLWILDRPAIHFQTGERPPPYGDRPDRWNIAGQQRLNNLELAQMIAEAVGKSLKYRLVDGNADRPGHDLHYGLDGTKLYESGWRHPAPLDEALRKTVRWYLDNPEWLELPT